MRAGMRRRQRLFPIESNVWCPRVAAAMILSQAGLGSVEGLDLALFVEREHDSVLRRIDMEPNDVADLGRELRIVQELEGADAVRRQISSGGADIPGLPPRR